MGIRPVTGLRDAACKFLSILVSYKAWIYASYAGLLIYCFPAIAEAGAVQVALGFLFGLAVLVISERAFVKWLDRGGNQPPADS